MPSKSIFDPEKITILDVKLINGQVHAPEDFNTEDVIGHHLDTEFQLGFSLEEKQIRADLKITIKTESEKKNKKEALGKFEFIYIYHVGNLEDLAKLNKQKVMDVNIILAQTIATLTYSTSRGVLITRMQGTALQTCILPVLNPNKLLQSKSSEPK